MVWATAVILSPFLGPFIACFIVGHPTWRWAYWSLAILSAVAWLLIVAVYGRDILSTQFGPKSGSGPQVLRPASLWNRAVED